MKKLTLMLSLILCFSFVSFAQTERIAMRSHSGTNNSSSNANDNWGLPSEYLKERRAKDDSIRKAWEYRRRQDSILKEKSKKDSIRIATIKKSGVRKTGR